MPSVHRFETFGAMIYGYARVSTIDQDLSIQHAALTAVGCTVVRSEKVTGTSTEGREELATLLQFLREGDTLVVTRVDRLALFVTCRTSFTTSGIGAAP